MSSIVLSTCAWYAFHKLFRSPSLVSRFLLCSSNLVIICSILTFMSASSSAAFSLAAFSSSVSLAGSSLAGSSLAGSSSSFCTTVSLNIFLICLKLIRLLVSSSRASRILCIILFISVSVDFIVLYSPLLNLPRKPISVSIALSNLLFNGSSFFLIESIKIGLSAFRTLSSSYKS